MEKIDVRTLQTVKLLMLNDSFWTTGCDNSRKLRILLCWQPDHIMQIITFMQTKYRKNVFLALQSTS